MPTAPPTRYARSGDVDIAYQVFGDGSLDFVFVPGWVWNLELAWELSEIERFFERAGRFARVVLVEKRGVGLSDRVSGTPTLEARADDIRAVMDAVGLERAAVGGWFDGAAMAAHFAATYPERVSALVLGNMAPRALDYGDRAGALDPQTLDAIAETIQSGWGEATILDIVAPSYAHDERVVAFWRRFERMSATPNAAAALFHWNATIDLRAVLPAIQAPTLVLHRSGIRLIPLSAARGLADLIPGAQLVEMPGDDMYPFFGDCASLLDRIEEFLTGAPPTTTDSQRVLLTVVFTDIVGSTTRAAELGDNRWRDLLADHHREIRRLLPRYEGHEVDTAGDGFLVTFSGPARAIQFACAARDAVHELGIDIRVGLHTGEVERRDGNIVGLAVHVGARVAAQAGPGEVLVTGTVKDLVLGSGIEFEDRGVHTLKGVPDQWRLFAVVA